MSDSPLSYLFIFFYFLFLFFHLQHFNIFHSLSLALLPHSWYTTTNFIFHLTSQFILPTKFIIKSRWKKRKKNTINKYEASCVSLCGLASVFFKINHEILWCRRAAKREERWKLWDLHLATVELTKMKSIFFFKFVFYFFFASR